MKKSEFIISFHFRSAKIYIENRLFKKKSTFFPSGMFKLCDGIYTHPIYYDVFEVIFFSLW